MNTTHSKFWLFCTVAALVLTCLLTCSIKSDVDRDERNRIIDSVRQAQANELRQQVRKP